MSVSITSYGKHVRDLRSQLRAYPAEVRTTTRADAIQRGQDSLNQLGYRLTVLEREERTLSAEKRRLEAEIIGLERSMELGTIDVAATFASRTRARVNAARDAVAEVTRQLDFVRSRAQRSRIDARGICVAMIEELERSIEEAGNADRRRLIEQRARELVSLEHTVQDGDPMWSPSAIVGYRVWMVSDRGVMGMRQQWKEPRLDAVCRQGTDLPHTGERCQPFGLGCGVYAAKDVEVLLRETRANRPTRFVAGAVELTGKVVEHERGYRARSAHVVSAVLWEDGVLRTFVEDSAISQLFTNPRLRHFGGAAIDVRPGTDAVLHAAIREQLHSSEEEEESWT